MYYCNTLLRSVFFVFFETYQVALQPRLISLWSLYYPIENSLTFLFCISVDNSNASIISEVQIGAWGSQ